MFIGEIIQYMYFFNIFMFRRRSRVGNFKPRLAHACRVQFRSHEKERRPSSPVWKIKQVDN